MDQKKLQISVNDYHIWISGISEIGAAKRINQDAFRIGINTEKQLAYIIVADGLGSCRYSDQGSQKITEIVENWILQKLPEYTVLSEHLLSSLIREIINKWNETYDSEKKHEYDTTFHVAVFYKGDILIGGLGDGMALIRFDETICRDCINKKNWFSNVTDSICSSDAEKLMKFEIIPADYYLKKGIVILTTDGISDDLVPDKKLSIPAYFQNVISKDGINQLQMELIDWIGDWQTDGYSDDRTLCYMAIERNSIND